MGRFQRMPNRTGAWKRTAVSKALEGLKAASANAAGAGPDAVTQFRGHVLTIVSAAKDPFVKQLAEHLVSCAELLFVGPPTKPESDYRRRLFKAYDALREALKSRGLCD